jgi:hypothetical protein
MRKCGRLSQQNPLGKEYSGPLLINATKLKDIWDLFPYIPAVNHPFYENLRADSSANRPLDLEELD